MAVLIDLWYSDRSEKAMAPQSSTLAWKIPSTEEPGRLQSMGGKGASEMEHFGKQELEPELG